MKRYKKILIISDFFYPHWTGLSKSLYYLVTKFDKDWLFTVLTVRYKKSLRKKEKLFNTIVIREDPLFSISRAKYSIKLLFRFLQIIRHYDSVLINSPCTNILPVAILSKVFGKKLYIFHQGDLILPKGIINKIIERIFDISSLVAFTLAYKISTYTLDYAKNSRVMKQFLYKCFPFLVPFPDIYKVQQKKLIGKNFIFGFAGRFVEEKGFDILFRAIPQIIKKIPEGKFLYAGEENLGYENFFEKNKEEYNKVKRYIVLLGLLKEKELVLFYEKVHFLIVPSRTDCFNLVQVEAMLSGTPVIATNIPGLRIPVRETDFGKLFKKENADDLARVVINAVSEYADILKNREKVELFFDSKKINARIERFFSD